MLDDDHQLGHRIGTRGLDIFASLHGKHVAAHNAGSLHPRSDADHKDDQQEDPVLRPERIPQRVAEQHDNDQQKRQQGQRKKQVRQPHQRAIQDSEEARQHTDNRSDDDRQQHCRETNRQRRSSARQDLREDVPADLVGTHRVLPTAALILVADVQISGIGRVNERANDDDQQDRDEDDCTDERALVGAELHPHFLKARQANFGFTIVLLVRGSHSISHSGSSDRAGRRAHRRPG